jgi:antitoxin PrlF
MAKAKASAKPKVQDGDCCGADCCGEGASCCSLPMAGCCEVHAVIGIDGRGQMVLPKEVREMANLKAGDKLAVVAWKKGEEVCCLSLVPASGLEDAVRKAYGPLLREMGRAY